MLNLLRRSLYQIFKYLIWFLLSGLAKPAGEDEKPQEEYDDNVQGDEDYNYTDDDTSNQQSKSAEENNNVDGPKPVVEKAYASYEAKPGENVRIPCYIKNKENEIVFWYMGKKPIFQDRQNIAHNERYTLGEDMSLSVHHVTDVDSAEYVCEALPSKVNMTSRLTVKSWVQINWRTIDRLLI